MATLGSLVHDTRNLLLSGQREPLNDLAVAIASTTATTFTFTYDLNFNPGDVLQLDSELVYVWTINEGAKTALVMRGHAGSTAATHAINSLVTVNPLFPTHRIVQEINNDLHDLHARGLFQVKTTTFTFSPAVMGYELPADLVDILDVTSDTAGPDQSFPRLRDWRVVRNTATTDFATAVGLVIYDDRVTSGQPVRVKYKAAFTSLTNLTDDVLTTSGLPTSAHDLPPMGAALRLMAPREIKRNFQEAQGQPRRMDEIPAGAVNASPRRLDVLRETRIGDELMLLARKYPHRSH